jgi:uncharacterized protein YjdB
MRTFMLAVTGLVFSIAACSSYGTSVVEVGKTRTQVASVSLTIPSSLVAGQTARAIATPKDASGAALTDRPVTWYTSSASIASVSDSGMISAVAPGTAVVSAVSEGIAGQANMAVMPPPPTPIATVLVAVNPSAVLVGQAALATATLEDSSGNPITGRAITWESSNMSVATVAATGDVKAVGLGNAMIKASSEGKTASSALSVGAPAPIPVASISVSPATASLQVGGTVQLSAVTRDANNNVLTGRVISWGSGNAGIATVSGSGLVTAIVAGSVSITASSEGQTTSAAITVSAPAPVSVASVSVSPATATLQIGGTVQLSAVTRDANNNVLAGRVITWSSSNTAISTVSASGLVTAVAAGSATITASSEGKTGSAAITVSAPAPVPVASVSVSPATATLQVGDTLQLSAVTRDANNNVLTGRVVSWNSGDIAVATVSGSGLVTSRAAGSTQITASSESKTGNASITVNAAPPPPPPNGSVEPTGMTVITERPFSALNEDSWTDGSVIAADATAPRSPSGIAQMVFPAGFGGGWSPADSYCNKTWSYRTQYLSVWMKVSSNWQGHSTTVNKVVHFWSGGLNHTVLNLWGAGSDKLYAGILLQGIVNDGAGNTWANWGQGGYPGGAGEFTRGQWHHIEVVMVGNTSGSANGSIDWWLDGVKIGSHSGIQYVSGDGSFQGMNWSPTWGGAGDVVTSTMTMSFDHFRLSGK